MQPKGPIGKRAPTLTLLAALTASLGACDADPGDQIQRDVYSGPQAFENCVADWGNEALCQQRLNDEEKKKLAATPGAAPGHSVFIWGPGYMGADRTVVHNGTQYTPTMQRGTHTSAFSRNSMKPTSFSAPRAPGVSSRGGFGAAGRGGGSAVS